MIEAKLITKKILLKVIIAVINITLKENIKDMVILEVIIVGLFLVIGIICFVILNKVRTTQKHLRQIEKKIDAVYTQIRVKDYANPSIYPFMTTEF